jgi:hypothetical protein
MNNHANVQSIAHFRRRDDRDELARINRLTGLSFETVPCSLVNRAAAEPVSPKTAAVLRFYTNADVDSRLRPAG